ncbi:HAMP domain-containing protein [Candidatus Kaiserbacteria bacterium]|nr:HAMP domain-containing protein [Candidatus Kaiserbacteria bacterium]
MKKKKNKVLGGIGRALLVPYLLSAFLILNIIGAIGYYSFTVESSYIEQLQLEVMDRASDSVDSYIQIILESLELTQKNLQCRYCVADVEGSLKNVFDNNASVYNIGLIDTNGDELYRLNRYSSNDNVVLRNVSEEEYFKEAVLGHRYISRSFYSEYELPSVSISLPVVSIDGYVMWVLVADIDLSAMWGAVTRVNLGDTGYIYVVDQSGRLISYKDISVVKQGLVLTDVQGVQNYLSNRKKIEAYSSFTGQEVRGISTTIPATGWGLIVELPKDEIEKKLLPFVVIAVTSFIVLMVLAIVLIRLTYRRLLVPIKKLQNGVAEIESGNLKHAIEVSEDDELGELALAFNEMSGRLDNAYTHLEQEVQERTSELLNTQKNLEEKLNEVGRLNDLMVNRELRMIELKSEIKKCKQEDEK